MGESSVITKELPMWRIVALSLALCGVQFQWTAAFATVTPFFKLKGLDDNNSNQVWVFGPLVGIIFGPLVGTLSDNCYSRMGRRRPFILIGTAALIVSLLLFGFSDSIGDALGDKGNDHSRCIAVAFVAFAVLNMSINVLQGPVRVVITDLLPESQQNLGQSLATLMQAIGAVLGNLVTYFLGVKQVHLIMGVGAALLFATVTITFLVANEIPLVRKEGHQSVGLLQTFKNIGVGIITMPNFLIRVCVLEVFVWFAWFCVLPTTTTWMGQVVFQGNSSAPKDSFMNDQYVDGTQYACIGLIFQAVAQALTSAVSPTLANKFGIKPVFFTTLVVFSGAMLGMGLVRNPSEKILGNIFIALLGIPFATTNIFPYSIISLFIHDPSQKGLYIGALNIFICLPQVIDTQIMGKIAQSAATASIGGEWLVMLIGAGLAALGAASVWFLDLKKDTGKLMHEPLLEEGSRPPSSLGI